MSFKLISKRPRATGHFQEQFELMYSQQSCLHLHIHKFQDDNSDVEVHSIGTLDQKLQQQPNQLNNRYHICN